MLGLAVELRRRGHDVTFATSDHFEKTIQECGLPFESLGTKEDFAAAIANPDLWHPRRAFRHIFNSFWPALRQQYQIHADRASRETIGITNCFGFGALTAQDKLGIRVITVHLQPAVIWSDHEPPKFAGLVGPRWLKSWVYRLGERLAIDPIVCPLLNNWRAELNLPPVKKITRWWNSPYGVLCLFPDWFAPPQPDWPTPLMQADFPLWNHRSGEPLAGDVEAFLQAGTPPIVFTPGSTNVHGEAFFAAAVEACRLLNRRGILLTQFADQIPRNLPGTVAHFRYVPLDNLLPRTAAFVHHGGVGSTSQAMLAGIPQIVMPLAHDQFDNAARIIRLGIGGSLPPRKFTGGRLAEKLDQLLSSPTIASNCRDIAQRLAARNGLSLADDAIEDRIDRQSN